MLSDRDLLFDANLLLDETTRGLTAFYPESLRNLRESLREAGPRYRRALDIADQLPCPESAAEILNWTPVFRGLESLLRAVYCAPVRPASVDGLAKAGWLLLQRGLHPDKEFIEQTGRIIVRRRETN